MSTSEIKLKLIDQIMQMDDSALSQFESILDEFNAEELPQWQKDILDKRLKEHRENPDDGADWAVVKERLRSRVKA